MGVEAKEEARRGRVAAEVDDDGPGEADEGGHVRVRPNRCKGQQDARQCGVNRSVL